MVAHRTSPTNIAMGLLSTLAAHDLGYIRTTELLEKLEALIGTMEGLERYEGHLLNWYDTSTLAPLAPRYVSTVDSGNLAGALIAAAEGLRLLAVNAQPLVVDLRRPARHGGSRACAPWASCRGTRHVALRARPARRRPDRHAQHAGGSPGMPGTRLERARAFLPELTEAIDGVRADASPEPDRIAAVYWARSLAEGLGAGPIRRCRGPPRRARGARARLRARA